MHTIHHRRGRIVKHMLLMTWLVCSMPIYPTLSTSRTSSSFLVTSTPVIRSLPGCRAVHSTSTPVPHHGRLLLLLTPGRTAGATFIASPRLRVGPCGPVNTLFFLPSSGVGRGLCRMPSTWPKWSPLLPCSPFVCSSSTMHLLLTDMPPSHCMFRADQ